MNKILAFSLAFPVILSAAPFKAMAANKSEKADLPEIVYQQLLDQAGVNTNNDDIITEDEYRNATDFSLDLDGVDSVDFLKRLVHPQCLYLSKGNISDFSFLAGFDTLEVLELSNMPQVTDISFAKEIDLQKFYIIGLEQITDDQKVEVMKFHDADTSVGFSDLIGATPKGMFEYFKFTLDISDANIASFENSNNDTIKDCNAYAYCKSAGSTEYTLKLNGNEIHKGRINVKETSVTTLPSEKGQTMPEIFDSYFYSVADKVILKDGTLYKLANDKLIAIAENVADFDVGHIYGIDYDIIRTETILYNDGTVEVNGKKIENAEGMHFKQLGHSLLITDNGDVYSLREEDDIYTFYLIYSGFGRFLEHSSLNFLSDKGEVIQIEIKKIIPMDYQAYPTGIIDVVDSCNYFFIDKNKVLWKIDRNLSSAPTVHKCAEDVIYVGYRYYDNGTVYGCVHITSDGTAYKAGTNIKVILTEMPPDSYRAADRFILPFGDSDAYSDDSADLTKKYDYHITNDNILCMEYDGKKAAVADVESLIAARKSDDGKTVHTFFLKTDGSIWYYSFDKQEYRNALSDALKNVKGDVNADGKFNTADIVTFQKLLLAKKGTFLKNWKAADMCEDNILDVFDLCLMRKELIAQSDNNMVIS